MAKDRTNKFANMVRRETTEETKEVIKELVNHELKISQLNFDYSKLDLDENDKGNLIDLERELKHHKKSFVEVSIEIGKVLHNARKILIKTHDESFVSWYTAMGLNKDNVRVFMARYEYVLEFPDKENVIKDLSDIAIKETLNKKNPQYLLEKVMNGELSTAEQIRKERKNNSTPVEKFSKEIEEAEIVEKRSAMETDGIIKKIKSKIGELELFSLENDGLIESDIKKLESILNELNKLELR